VSELWQRVIFRQEGNHRFSLPVSCPERSSQPANALFRGETFCLQVVGEPGDRFFFLESGFGMAVYPQAQFFKLITMIVYLIYDSGLQFISIQYSHSIVDGNQRGYNPYYIPLPKNISRMMKTLDYQLTNRHVLQ